MILNEQEFDTEIETIDWRYSAAAIGIIMYLNYHRLEYNREEIDSEDDKSFDILRFNKADITEERYLEFIEYLYCDELHHKIVENMLLGDEFTEEQIKFINGKIAGNTVMKKCFGKTKFDGTNAEEIKSIIETNRKELIKETYRNKKNLYANFCNTNQLFNERQSYCRLNGYYIDGPKKGKSISYNFNQSTYISNDELFFDFIPFAFTIGREAFFVNDNVSIQELERTNNELKKLKRNAIDEKNGNVDIRKLFFKAIVESSKFIECDVEVIVKNIENNYFETLFLRKESIEMLEKIKDFNCFCFSLKITDNYYINIQKKVTDAIINMIVLDDIIELFLKEDSKFDSITGAKNRYSYLIMRLIEINEMIRTNIERNYEKESKIIGGEDMKQSMKVSYACAKQVVETFEKRNQLNKISSYRTKLTSAIVFKDYDRFCDILIQLANYSDVQFDFAYPLFEDFEKNKDLAYGFVNALTKKIVVTDN